MGSNSFVGKVGLDPTHPGNIGSIGNDLLKGHVGDAWSQSFGNEGLGGFISTGLGLNPPKGATLEDPSGGSHVPTLAETNTTALQNQLMNEQNSYSTSTMLTSGRGVAQTPQSTSQMLLGS